MNVERFEFQGSAYSQDGILVLAQLCMKRGPQNRRIIAKGIHKYGPEEISPMVKFKEQKENTRNV